jgi:RNase H-like domain found in reverse transcriptase
MTAFDIATGATLLPVDNLNSETTCTLSDEELHPSLATKICTYMSHLSNKDEPKYQVRNKELLAIYLATKAFRSLLL